MIETNYVPTYMKINTCSKDQFSVIYYVSNTIILYFTVHCIYVLCLYSAWYMYACITVSGMFCSVKSNYKRTFDGERCLV